MSSNAVEPGTRLVDRYRLEEHLGEADGTSYWRAQDELLDRPVGICLLPASDGNARPRCCAPPGGRPSLTDARFLRVLDASEVDGVVYVVSEWVSATNLVDLLADGPMPPGEARQLGIDVAEALAAAHRAGLAHLCLQPEHVLRTTHGQVKVGGLAVDAAVRGVECAGEADAARRDTWGAARDRLRGTHRAVARRCRHRSAGRPARRRRPVQPAAGPRRRPARPGPHPLPGAGHPRAARHQPLHDPVELARALAAVHAHQPGPGRPPGRTATSRRHRRTSPRTSRRTTTRPAGPAAAPPCWPGRRSRSSWSSASRWPAGSW